MSSKIVFGIYLGNSTACIAICRDSKVDILANEAGDRVTPAVVAFSDQEEVVGAAAKVRIISQATSTIIKNKRALNIPLSESDIEAIVRDTKVQIDTNKDSIIYKIENKTVNPTYVTSVILKTLYGIAKSALHIEDDDISCVIQCPTHFTPESRKHLRKAASDAGWNVLHMINEPCAAVLGYGINTETPEHNTKVLVYRCGGISCDVTILEIQHGLISIVESVHSIEVGGEKIVKKLLTHLQEEIQRKHRLDISDSGRSVAKLRQAAETCMHVLSTLQSSNVFVESLYDGLDFNHNVSRARFESLLGDLLKQFILPIEDVLQKSKVTHDQINKLLLVGGPLKIPKLQSHIKSFFPNAILPTVSTINPDEILAAGAARQAGYLTDMFDMEKHLPEPNMDLFVIANDVTVKVLNTKCEDIRFETNMPLPCYKKVLIDEKTGNTLSLEASQVDKDGKLHQGQVEFKDLNLEKFYIAAKLTLENKLNFEILDTNSPAHVVQSRPLTLTATS